jgi:exopolysaccharide biosynthesis WecB/TagA/CpsF family protein
MSTEQILGIKFFNGEVDRAINFISERGGFLVAPSGTCFARLRRDEAYREAMINADVAIPDSGALVLLWKLFRGETVNRISGWKYLRCFSNKLFADKSGGVLWVLPNEIARKSTARWLTENGFPFSDDDFYLAPFYGAVGEDRYLVEKIHNRRPRHVVVGIGSGPQEKLGYYLREHLNYRPAIHCIGAALGFMTGEQVKIPAWGDRFYLGWLFRLFANPRRYLPRLWRATELPWLLLRYGRNLPPLRSRRQKSEI